MAIDYSEVTIVIIMETFVQRRHLSHAKLGSFAAIGLAYFLLLISSGFVTISDRNNTHQWNYSEPPKIAAAGCLILCLLLGVARKRIAHRATLSEPLRRNHKLLNAYSTSMMAIVLFPAMLLTSAVADSYMLTEMWSPARLVFVLLEVGGLFLVLDFFMEANVRRRVASSLLAKVGLITQFLVCLVYEYFFSWLGSYSLLTFLAFGLMAGGQHFLLTTAGALGHAEDSGASPLGGSESGLPMEASMSPHASRSHRSNRENGVGSFLSSFFDLVNQQSDSYGYDHDDHDRVHRHNDYGDRSASHGFDGLERPTLVHRLLSSASQVMQEIWDNPTSRKIFLFMLVNFAFMFVELAYGIWTNSLGLITDAFHMLFDCTALGIGLYAEVVSRWPRSKNFTFGFGRVEVLAGYLNGVFLCFISFSIFAHSLVRMWSPPTVITDRLLLVSTLGLVVNLIGIFAFHDFDVLELIGLKKKKDSHDHDHHHHGHDHGHGHSHSHGHGHGHDCGHQHSDNLTGIFLHILADALGSVSVIISSILIWQFGWDIVDPICSLLISVLIFASVIPLLKSSVGTLMQTTPSNLQERLPSLMQQLYATPGVISCTARHFWTLTSSQTVGSVQLQTSPQVDKQQILHNVQQACRRSGVSELTVQMETDHSYSQSSYRA